MKRILFALSPALLLATGCFQTIDNGVSGGGPLNSTDTGGGDDASVAATGNGLPAPFAGADLNQQCEAGSALCYELCLSPECATTDGGGGVVINPTLQTPAAVLPEGGATDDSCVALEAESMQVRERSCSGCHGPMPALGFAGFNYVLDDSKLVGGTASTGQPMVAAGDPLNSYVWQRMNAGLANPMARNAMPPTPCSVSGASTAVCSNLVYPSAEDVSIMYAWILNCAGSQDGGVISSRYYGGNYGPGGDSGGPPPAQPPPSDAGKGGGG